MRVIDPRAVELIKSFEQMRLVAYKPTEDDVWTIGWGHTKGVKEGMFCTALEADAWLLEDLQSAAEVVYRAVQGVPIPISASAIGALVSLVFNAGSLGPTIAGRLRTGNIYGAWEFMARWRKQGSKDLRGLARRRALEMALFMEDKFPAPL